MYLSYLLLFQLRISIYFRLRRLKYDEMVVLVLNPMLKLSGLLLLRYHSSMLLSN